METRFSVDDLVQLIYGSVCRAARKALVVAFIVLFGAHGLRLCLIYCS